MDFETYLRNKKIDPIIFGKEEPMLWHEFKTLFDQVHPDSFTAQKLFLINGIRRKYPLKEEAESKTGSAPAGDREEGIKPKPKIPMPSSAPEKAKPKMTPKVKIPPKIRRKE